MCRTLTLSIRLAAPLLMALGCATYHTVEPYRSDLEAAHELEVRAERVCVEMGREDRIPKRRFVTDGCSGVPDGKRVACCVEHDIPYWCGGSSEQRREADRGFARCVGETGSPTMGHLMGWGLRVTGHPLVPAGWRWGFGHPYPAGYEDPTTEETPEP